MTIGDQLPAAFGFAAAQVPVPGAGSVLHVYPHMGTDCPSGSTACVGAAVRPTVAAEAAPLAARRTAAASPDRTRPALELRALIAVLPMTISIRRFCKRAGLPTSSSTCPRERCCW